jgi:hypothetical protein
VKIVFGRIGTWPQAMPVKPGANPTTFDFTTTTPALYVEGLSVFTSEKNIFCSKNALSCWLRCNFFYNATGSLARFENKYFYSILKKALAYYNAGVVAVNLKNRRIGSRVRKPVAASFCLSDSFLVSDSRNRKYKSSSSLQDLRLRSGFLSRLAHFIF